MREYLENLRFHEQIPLDLGSNSLIGIRHELTSNWIILGIIPKRLSDYLCSKANEQYDFHGYVFFTVPLGKWIEGNITPIEVSETIPNLWMKYKQYQYDLEQSISDCFNKIQEIYEQNPIIQPDWPVECIEFLHRYSCQSSSEQTSSPLQWFCSEPSNNDLDKKGNNKIEQPKESLFRSLSEATPSEKTSNTMNLSHQIDSVYLLDHMDGQNCQDEEEQGHDAFLQKDCISEKTISSLEEKDEVEQSQVEVEEEASLYKSQEELIEIQSMIQEMMTPTEVQEDLFLTKDQEVIQETTQEIHQQENSMENSVENSVENLQDHQEIRQEMGIDFALKESPQENSKEIAEEFHMDKPELVNVHETIQENSKEIAEEEIQSSVIVHETLDETRIQPLIISNEAMIDPKNEILSQDSVIANDQVNGMQEKEEVILHENEEMTLHLAQKKSNVQNSQTSLIKTKKKEKKKSIRIVASS